MRRRFVPVVVNLRQMSAATNQDIRTGIRFTTENPMSLLVGGRVDDSPNPLPLHGIFFDKDACTSHFLATSSSRRTKVIGFPSASQFISHAGTLPPGLKWWTWYSRSRPYPHGARAFVKCETSIGGIRTRMSSTCHPKRYAGTDAYSHFRSNLQPCSAFVQCTPDRYAHHRKFRMFLVFGSLDQEHSVQNFCSHVLSAAWCLRG